MGFPNQKIAYRLKGKAWKKDTMDHFDMLTYSSVASNRNSNYTKKINYDLFNGLFNKKDLEYVCNPIGLGDNEYPATLQHYDIVSPPLNLLIGEETKRPDKCIVVSESPNDINRKQNGLKQRITELLQQHLMAEIDPSTVDPSQPLPTPEQIIKYEKYNISDLIEGKANKLLKHLKKYLNTKEIFKKGWKDALITGEEIYWSGISNKEVLLRRCNPLNTTVVLDQDTDFIDDAIAVVEVRMMAIASILDELGDELSNSDLDKLEELSRRFDGPYNRSGQDPTFVYTTDSNGNPGAEFAGGSFASGNQSSGSYNSEMIRVVRAEWKSFKKMFYITYTDENGILQEDIQVDETFDPNIFKQLYPDTIIEEFWIPEAWEGIKIGDEIYVACGPKPNQRRRMDNPYYCKLGYIGLIYNATNSVSTSLLDRLKPYQYLYNIISYRLELAFATDQGKKMLMDVAQIPRSEGIDLDRWMYYFKAMGIGFINSFEEGKKGVATGKLAGQSGFNQFQSIDLSLANTIQQYINTLDYIKQQVAFVSGVSPQRLGAIQSQELVGNVERSVQQSALITEYLFDSHDEVKRRVYTAIVECAKIAYKDGKKIQYVLDDMGVELLDIEELELEDSEFNVFMSNSAKDNAAVEMLKQLAKDAISMDKADLSTIIDTMINDSPREIMHTLRASEKAKYERDKQTQDAQNQLQAQQMQVEQQMHADQLASEEADRALKQYEIDTNNQTKIMVAEISALSGKDGPSDMDGDGIPDPIEVAKISLEERDLASKNFLEQTKLKHENDKVAKEIANKEREIKMKEEIENKKIEAIKVQNQSQEKIANAQLSADKERAKLEKEMHAKEMAIKMKELELKKADNKNKLEIEKIKLQAAKQKAAADAQKQKIMIRKAAQSAKKKPKQ